MERRACQKVEERNKRSLAHKITQARDGTRKKMKTIKRPTFLLKKERKKKKRKWIR